MLGEMLDVSMATGALEIVALPAVLLVVAIKLAVTATEVLELVAAEIQEVMIGGGLDVTNGGILHVITDETLEVMIGGALEVITGGVLEVTTGGILDAMTGGALEVMTGGTLNITTGGALDVMTGGALEEMTGGVLEVVAAIEQVGISFEISGTVTARIVPSIVNVAIMVIERIGCSAYLFHMAPSSLVYLCFCFPLSFLIALFLFRRWFIVGVVVVSRNDGAQVPATKSSSSLSISDLPPGYNAHLKLIFCTKCSVHVPLAAIIPVYFLFLSSTMHSSPTSLPLETLVVEMVVTLPSRGQNTSM